MARLTNRQMQIPGGIKFFQPETNFKISGQSFNSTVDAVIRMRQANPAMVQAKGWATDFDNVANEVDAFNAAICERMGWSQYINHPAVSAPAPKFKALSPLAEKQLSAAAGTAKKVWQGVRTLNDWLDSGEPAVPQEQSERRAAVCVACKLNGKGGLEEWFIKPAAAAIKLQFDKLSQRKLSTSQDDKINVCTACLCPLKLKVHTPLPYITAHLKDDVRGMLDANCWILKEERSQMSTMVDTPKA